jgi:hypothetical protein
MTDPVAGLREMGRVCSPGGTVAACVWDHAGDRGPLTTFWQAVRETDPQARDESGLAGVRRGHLVELFGRAGLGEAKQTTLTVQATYATFEQWWEPYTFGIGPAGGYVASLPQDRRQRLRDQCRQLLPAEPVQVSATAWVVTASV